MSSRPLVVLKLGGSVLTGEAALAVAASEVYRHVRAGERVVAVVSALAGATDRLLAEAQGIAADPDPYALAELLATGEATSVALLCLALGRSGVPATPLDAVRAGLSTRGPVLDAELVGVDVPAILRALEERPVVVIPGFVGRSAEGGHVTLLGRGGSDLTALYLAGALGASRCRLVKDVDGLFERDPAGPGPAPRRYERIRWEDALRLDGRVVQRKALRFAFERRLAFEVSSPGSGRATAVGEGPTAFAPAAAPRRPLRVVLLGLGNVGLGIHRRLAAEPERYEVVGALVRDLDKHRQDGVAPGVLSCDPGELAGRPHDLVIEAMGGDEPAASLVGAALEAGRDVVTANKEVVGRHGARLEGIAARSGARFAYSAAVGGAVPVLEWIDRLGRQGGVRSIEGVLNGTTNFILEAVSEGASFEDAVLDAQLRGFAEPDPTVDLDGTDAARKVSVIVRRAWGRSLPPEAIERTGIAGLQADAIRAARREGRSVRLVASCRLAGDRLEARVEPRVLSADHPLAGTRGEENRVLIESDSGRFAISGKGAGRWPTTESVLADVGDVLRLRQPASAPGRVRS